MNVVDGQTDKLAKIVLPLILIATTYRESGPKGNREGFGILLSKMGSTVSVE